MPIDEPKLKAKLTRHILENHGITFSEKVYDPDSPDVPQHGTTGCHLPEHVESIRKILLLFRAAVPESRRKFFNTEAQRYSTVGKRKKKGDCIVQPPKSAYLKQAKEETETMIDDNHDVAKKAWKAAHSKVMEESWSSFMSEYIFKPFEKVHVEATEYESLFDCWALETGAHWNEENLANYDPSITKPTAPKPDRTYGFSIHESPDKSFADHESVINFSLKVLGELYSQGLISAPLSGLSNWVKDNGFEILAPHLMCFPWAIVELKSLVARRSQTTKAYCQAANATSAALTLFEKLFQLAGRADDRIPPVVSFTCIGPFIRVWLAYSSTLPEKSRCHRMVCIWSGTLTTTWGVMVTREIVKQMLWWASRVLKPQLSGCISQIRRNKSLNRSDPMVYQDTLGSTNRPATETPPVQQPSPTEETVVVTEDTLPQEPNNLHQRELLQGENLVQETSTSQGHASLSSEGVVDGESKLQTPDSGETNPITEPATPRDLSVPQSPVPDTSRSTSDENTSEASTLGPKRSPSGSSSTPSTGYNSESGPTNQPAPNKTDDSPQCRSVLGSGLPNQRTSTGTSDNTSKITPLSRSVPGFGFDQPAPTETADKTRKFGSISSNLLASMASGDNTWKAITPQQSTPIFGQPTPNKTNDPPPHSSPGFGPVSSNLFPSMASGDNIGKTTQPRRKYKVKFPEVEETASQEHNVQHDGQETVSRTHENAQRSNSEPDDVQEECSAATRSEDNNLNAAVGTIPEHDADAPLLGESTDSLTNKDQDEVDDLASALSTIELSPVLESHDSKIARHGDVADQSDETRAYRYHEYRFSDMSNWIATGRPLDSLTSVSDKSNFDDPEDDSGSESSSAEQSLYSESEYEPSEASTSADVEDHEDCASSVAESQGDDFEADDEVMPSQSSSEDDDDDDDDEEEPVESGDYESSITESTSTANSDSYDSSESEETEESEESEAETTDDSRSDQDVLEDQYGSSSSILDESAIHDMFRSAARALRGSEAFQSKTIRDKVDSLSRKRLHDIIRSVISTIMQAYTTELAVLKTEYKEFLGVLSEAVEQDIGLGDDGTDVFDLDYLVSVASISREQWQSIDEGIYDIRQSDKELLKELCWTAIACMDSRAVIKALWTAPGQRLSEREYLAIGKEALEFFYSQPVKRRRGRR